MISHLSIKLSGEKLSSSTTSNEHFLNWKAGMPSRGFSEMPSYVGHYLFPTREREFKTSTGLTFTTLDLSKPKIYKRSENQGNLKPEGEMDLNTNYRDEYIKFKEIDRAKKVSPDSHSSKIFSKDKIPILGVTQNKLDFKFYPDHRPPQPFDHDFYASDLNKHLYPGEK
jgi:hypothetical protein